MNFNNDYINIKLDAAEALKKIKEIKERNYIKESKNAPVMFTPPKNDVKYDEFIEEDWEEKVYSEGFIFNELSKNVPEKYKSILEDEIKKLYDCAKEIYEQINVNSDIYGFKNRNVNNTKYYYESESEQIVYEHFEKNYYSLTPTQRISKFQKAVVQKSVDEILENQTSPDEYEETTTACYKSVIVEDLIKKITLPNNKKILVENLISDPSFLYFSNAEVLEDMLENYNKQAEIVSRIIAEYI